MTLPYLHRPHDSGPIQWARGDVGLKPLRLPRAALRVNYTVVNFFEFFFVCVVFSLIFLIFHFFQILISRLSGSTRSRLNLEFW